MMVDRDVVVLFTIDKLTESKTTTTRKASEASHAGATPHAVDRARPGTVMVTPARYLSILYSRKTP